MKLSDGVEWAIHCALLLAALPPEGTLSGRALAAFHGVPESYLLKHLKVLAAEGILQSVTGPRGGYRLARRPDEVSLLDIVDAVEGREPAFRCTEIRRRGPCAEGKGAYPRPCGINTAMLRAEAAYRQALARETLNQIGESFLAAADKKRLARMQDWIGQNMRMPRS